MSRIDAFEFGTDGILAELLNDYVTAMRERWSLPNLRFETMKNVPADALIAAPLTRGAFANLRLHSPTMGHIGWRNVAARAAGALAVVGGTAGGGLIGSGIEAKAVATPVADIRQTLGFYPGFGNDETLRALEQELGFNVTTVVQFGARTSPDDFTGSIIGQLGRLSDWIAERNPLYSVAIPLAFGEADARSEAGRHEVTANLQRAAAGEHDGIYQAAAVRLLDAGLEDAVLRIGHEFDADWYPWSAQPSCEAYVMAFRHVVDVFRQVSPAFRIEWTGGLRRFAEFAECAYPGDQYVNFVGMTVFDKGGPIAEFSRETGTWRNPEATFASQFLPRLQFHQRLRLRPRQARDLSRVGPGCQGRRRLRRRQPDVHPLDGGVAALAPRDRPRLAGLPLVLHRPGELRRPPSRAVQAGLLRGVRRGGLIPSRDAGRELAQIGVDVDVEAVQHGVGHGHAVFVDLGPPVGDQGTPVATDHRRAPLAGRSSRRDRRYGEMPFHRPDVWQVESHGDATEFRDPVQQKILVANADPRRSCRLRRAA